MTTPVLLEARGLTRHYRISRGLFRGTTLVLGRVAPDDVRRIARYYWVRRIALAPG